jgi:hypothetical protein
MKRRQLLKTGALLASPALLNGCAGEMEHFPTWRYGREAVFELLFKPRKLQGSSWTLPQMLQHAAQSIEYSVQGFPELKPAWFRATLGATAFTFFNARGAMSHTLDEPIPGAPALDASVSLKDAVQRLLAAMDAFSAHKGEFFPHFAYGKLNREQYERAHLMHLANHWQQLSPSK